MWEVEDNFTVQLGGNTFVNTPNLVTFQGEPLFTIERRESDGLLGISFDLRDTENKRVATIRENRIVQGNEEDYEIIREADRYAVVEKSTNRTVCDIRLRSKAKPAELLVSVQLYTPEGELFDATPDETKYKGLTLRGNIIAGSGTGIAIDDNSVGIG